MKGKRCGDGTEKVVKVGNELGEQGVVGLHSCLEVSELDLQHLLGILDAPFETEQRAAHARDPCNVTARGGDERFVVAVDAGGDQLQPMLLVRVEPRLKALDLGQDGGVQRVERGEGCERHRRDGPMKNFLERVDGELLLL